MFSTAALGEKVLSTSTLEDWLCTFLQPHLASAQPAPPQMKSHSPPDPTITGGVLPATKSPHRKFFIFIPPSEIHLGKCLLFVQNERNDHASSGNPQSTTKTLKAPLIPSRRWKLKTQGREKSVA